MSTITTEVTMKKREALPNNACNFVDHFGSAIQENDCTVAWSMNEEHGRHVQTPEGLIRNEAVSLHMLNKPTTITF